MIPPNGQNPLYLREENSPWQSKHKFVKQIHFQSQKFGKGTRCFSNYPPEEAELHRSCQLSLSQLSVPVLIWPFWKKNTIRNT